MPNNVLDCLGTLWMICIWLNVTNFVQYIMASRLTIVSREAKKKQAVCDEQVSYLHVAPL